jgi:hypothetical protein
MKRMQSLVVLVGLALGGCDCGGSGGHIVGAEPGTAFVTERPALHVSAREGLVRVRLDGTERTRIFPAGRRVEDYTPDGRLWVLSDSDTNLYIADEGGAHERPVPELAKRASAARLSPDGTRVAVSRHADFDKPQSSWRDDDTVYVVDTGSLEVKRYPPVRESWVISLGWNDAGTEVWLGHQDNRAEWLNLEDGARRERDPNDRPNAFRPAPASTCGDLRLRSDDTGIFLVAADGTQQQVVTIQGRERGFHDYLPTVDGILVTPSCRHLVFGFAGDVWVVQLETHRVGLLADDASPAFFLPDAP